MGLIDIRVSTHDHVGSMDRTQPDRQRCTECGQEWVVLKDATGKPTRLSPLPYHGAHTARQARVINP